MHTSNAIRVPALFLLPFCHLKNSIKKGKEKENSLRLRNYMESVDSFVGANIQLVITETCRLIIGSDVGPVGDLEEDKD